MELIKLILLNFLNTIPETLLILSLGLTFWGESIKHYKKNILLFAFVGLPALASNYLLPAAFHIIFAAGLFFLAFFFMFKRIHWRKRIIISLFSYALTFIFEVTPMLIISQFTSWRKYIESPFLVAVTELPLIISFGLVLLFMLKKEIHPGKKILKFLDQNKMHPAYFLLLIPLFQVILFVILDSYTWTDIQSSSTQFFNIILLISVFASLTIIFLSLKLITHSKDEAVKMTQELYIEDINRMFTVIKGQRHDFLNHVQVIKMMLEREKFTDAQKYVRELTGEIAEMNEIINIGHPALAALIRSKIAQALENQIKFYSHFDTIGEWPLGMKSIDIVKILGNLIDNAFEETLHLSESQRWVEVKGWNERGILHISVQNPGRIFKHDELSKLFDEGFSTKQGHSGVGLSIVKERINHYKGDIEVKSIPSEGTTFTIRLPLNTKPMQTDAG